MRGTIAIVDLLLCWPPDAGAFVDVVNVASRLARGADVTLVLPRMESLFGTLRPTITDRILSRYTRFFLRGAISDPLPFSIRHIDFTGVGFLPKAIGHAYLKVLDELRPNLVFITNGWRLKAHLARACAKWKPILRIYAHEFLCNKADGWFFRNGRICERNYLNGRFSDYVGCLACCSSFYAGYPAARWVQEYALGGAWAPSYRGVVSEALASASTVIVYNEFTAERVRPFNPDVRVIPSGVDCRTFSPGADKSAESVTVIVPGRVNELHKGRDFLAEVASVMARARPKMRFLVTGNTRGFSGPNIVPAGWLPPDELPEFYRQAHIAFIPSLWPEPQGIVALEAAASGLPLVVSAVGGLKDMVVDGKTGFHVKPGDVPGAVEALCALHDDEKLRDRLGSAARVRCVQHYDWDSIFETHYRPLFLGARDGEGH